MLTSLTLLSSTSSSGVPFVMGWKNRDQSILVPRAHDHSDLRQGSRALAGTNFLSMRRVFVSCSQPIRFDGKSMKRGLPVLYKARALDPCRRSEGSWLWGREWDRSPSLTKRIAASGNEIVLSSAYK